MDKYPKTHIKIVIATAFFFIIAISALPAKNDIGTTSIPISLSIKAVDSTPQPHTLKQQPNSNQTAPENKRLKLVVKSGDSLASIFQKAGLSARDLHNLMSLGKNVAVLKRILPGQSLDVQLDDNGNLLTLQYKESALKKLTISKTNGRFIAKWSELKPEILISYKTAKITKSNPSLYQAGKAAGLSDNLIMKMSYVFQWDISFALDLRIGDSFTLLYEDVYVNGDKIKEGSILAAQFNNAGNVHKAVLYEDQAGHRDYFTPDGKSMRKAFLRDPVHFSHVSSSFNMKRLHPIHKRIMPHRGIDYAANRGTPVLAAGDGIIEAARRNSASGRFVVIKHGQRYTTKYLHLSAYAKGIRSGKRVKQGQTIGYVGATGWATAPHLHYEFLVNGVHRNPKTVKLPKAEPINKSQLKAFYRTTQAMIARLDSISGSHGYASIR